MIRPETTLIEGLQHTDAKLYQFLKNLAGSINIIQNELDPLVITVSALTTSSSATSEITNFTYTLQSNGIRFDWVASGIANYELREGIDFDNGIQLVVTPSLTTIIPPTTTGLHYYHIKSISSLGDYSETASSLVIDILAPGQVVLSSQIIDNFVLLSWTNATTTFSIDKYNIYRDSILIGSMKGNFLSRLELISGTYVYGVQVVDIAGNLGEVATITTTVSQPADYELLDSVISGFTGTKTNVILDTYSGIAKLVGLVNTEETWEEHFTTNFWTTIQDQIDANYTLYCMPAKLTGSYVEVIDFEEVFGSVIINLDWSVETIIGTVNVTSTLEFSEDNITWTAPVSGPSAFASSMQYTRVTINFTGADNKSLIYFSNLNILLDVKKEVDAGSIVANKDDANGTEVTFNKTFKDVESITLTAKSIEPIYPVYNFTDIPNPTSFFVLIFDSTGKRITYTVSWMARGLV